MVRFIDRGQVLKATCEAYPHDWRRGSEKNLERHPKKAESVSNGIVPCYCFHSIYDHMFLHGYRSDRILYLVKKLQKLFEN